MVLSNQIQQLLNKVQLLLKQYAHSQREVQRLAKENEALKNRLQLKSEQVTQLQQKIEALGFTSVNLNDNAKKDLEKRINIYLKEIDNCLALLNG